MNPGAHDNCTIKWAAHNGHVDVVRYLCELPADRGVNPAAQDNYAIRWAALNDHVGVVRYLCGVLPPRSQHIQCASQGVPLNRAAHYLYHAHTMTAAVTWQHRPGFGKYHTLFARMSARRPLLVLRALVRGFGSDDMYT